MTASTPETLLSLLPPEGRHAAWWPTAEMRDIRPYPTTWVTVAERGDGLEADFRWCALLQPDHVPEELARDRSLAGETGEVEIFDDTFHDGMADHSVGHLEFFCQIRLDDLEEPAVDWSLPFLWYWRAFRRGDVWVFRDAAGRDVELARFVISDEGFYRVEVAAMPLRHYLHRRARNLLIDFNLNTTVQPATPFEREDFEASSGWVSAGLSVFEWNDSGGEVLAAVWVHGQYVVLPADGAAGPSWCSHDDTEPGAGVQFVHGVDEQTGAAQTVTPTLANTGSDGALGPHAFTRIWFRPQVLERYTAEPRRYRVTASRIECLHLWGLSIGRSSDGLVEVDLYDLRTKPRSELLHWHAHNVPPSGGAPDEGKARRERLNIPASSPDPVRDLHQARNLANAAATTRLGGPLWRDLVGDNLIEWEALHPPTGDDRTALQQPLLTLTKALCDQLDQNLIDQHLVGAPPAGSKSLVRLKQLVAETGADAEFLSPLFQLQTARSKGGFAHYAGSDTAAAIEPLAPGLTQPASIFTELTRRLVDALSQLASVLDPPHVVDM